MKELAGGKSLGSRAAAINAALVFATEEQLEEHERLIVNNRYHFVPKYDSVGAFIVQRRDWRVDVLYVIRANARLEFWQSGKVFGEGELVKVSVNSLVAVSHLRSRRWGKRRFASRTSGATAAFG